MNIWVVQTGEPLRHVDPNQREFRCSMLSRHLAARGHDVTRWANTFDHYTKSRRTFASNPLDTPDGYKIRFIQGSGYKKNISISRIKHFNEEARSFYETANGMDKPDLVFVCMPSISLTHAASQYCRANSIPYIVDIRDLWPDHYYTIFPRILHPLISILIKEDKLRLKKALSNSAALTALSPKYLQWAKSKTSGASSHQAERVIPMSFPRPVKSSIENPNQIVQELTGEPIPKDSFILSFFGTFVSSFSLETVIKAAEIFDSRPNDNIKFILAGSGTHKSELEELATKLSNIHFTGWLNGEQIAALVKCTSIGLAPYSSTALMSLPNKPFEYMAYGKPIINSLKGELAELVSSRGIGANYDADSPKSLVTSIELYKQNPQLLQEHSKNASLVYRTEFDSETVYCEASQFLEQVHQSNK